MSNYIPVPDDVFRTESDLTWITCRKWATGGSAEATGFANAGVLNAPIRDILGNTKWLRGRILTLEEDFSNHLIDSNAHASNIANAIEAFIANWLVPPQKIKAALSEEVGITNDDIESEAEIQESKLHLELRGETRPPLIEGAADTYSRSSELARDLSALYRRISGHSNAFSIVRNLADVMNLSGWVAEIPAVADQGAGGSFTFVGNRIQYVHDPDFMKEPTLVLSGIPLLVGQEKATDSKPYPGVFVAECGLEEDTDYFADLSSENMYEYTTLSRKDLVFLEMWAEDVPQDLGKIVPFGNTFHKNREADTRDYVIGKLMKESWLAITLSKKR